MVACIAVESISILEKLHMKGLVTIFFRNFFANSFIHFALTNYNVLSFTVLIVMLCSIPISN